MADMKYIKNDEEYMDLKAEDLENVSGGEEYYVNEYGVRVKAVTDWTECDDGGHSKIKRGGLSQATNSGKKK